VRRAALAALAIADSSVTLVPAAGCGSATGPSSSSGARDAGEPSPDGGASPSGQAPPSAHAAGGSSLPVDVLFVAP
jgi:hypothetical protein